MASLTRSSRARSSSAPPMAHPPSLPLQLAPYAAPGSGAFALGRPPQPVVGSVPRAKDMGGAMRNA